MLGLRAGCAPPIRATDPAASVGAPDPRLPLVGERGLEPPTRSTQSYAACEAVDAVRGDSGGAGASAYPGVSNEDPVGEILEAIASLTLRERAQLRRLLRESGIT